MKTIKEGQASISVPGDSVTKKSETFYNPAMAYQRDVTVSALSVYSVGKEPLEILDPLAATGIRGIRMLKEVKNVGRVHFNDLNPKAVGLVRKNLVLNGIGKKKYSITKKDAKIVMLEGRRRFDFVDIDPFGSPVYYLGNAGVCLKPRSLLGVTATDSGALAGSFPEACMRKYGAAVIRTPFPKELAVRVLITSIMRFLAPYELSFRPLYCHSNHYVRVIGAVEESVKKTDEDLRKIEMVYYSEDGKKGSFLGPIWMGPLQENAFVNDLFHDFVERGFGPVRELQLAMEEIGLPFYYDLHRISKQAGRGSPRMDDVIRQLRNAGFAVSRTHLEPKGIKTDASVDDIIKLL